MTVSFPAQRGGRVHQTRLPGWCLLGIFAGALLLAAGRAESQEKGGKAATLNFPRIEGAVMTPDGKTLIVSLPTEGTLVYIDTLAGKEQKKVEVDFQPSALAIQGDRLFAATQGAPRIHVIDVATGKAAKSIQLPGAPIQALGCHPAKGLLYATNAKHEVYAINPADGKFERTGAKGQLLVVDPAEGKYVYTGIQKPIQDVVIVKEGPNNTVRISLGSANLFAVMLKYEVADMDLRAVAANDTAAVNGRAMAVSADGKRIAMAGGGGYRTRNDPRANYSIAVFDTGNMKDLQGQVSTGAYPNGIAFHPHLNYGAAFRSGKDVILFRDKSFIKKATFTASQDCANAGAIMLFGGQGTQVIYISQAPPAFAKESVVDIFTLPLTEEDRATLRKAYPK
jgi:DNA-binding beta-propeller fold protein YncE